MTGLIGLLRSAVGAAWRYHFRIPRVAYWGGYAASILGVVIGTDLSLPDLVTASVILSVVTVQGLVRWAYYRSRPPVLSIPLFEASTPARAREVRRILLTTLRDTVPIPLNEAIQPIDVVVGPTDKRLPHRIRRELGALYLVYGEIRDGDAPNDYMVHSRLSLDPPSQVQHYDWVTMDVTPQRTIWDAIFHKLSPSRSRYDVEFPFRSADELRGLVAALAGELSKLIRRPDLAVPAFRAALAGLEGSESHAVDGVRCRLAHALLEAKDRAAALQLLVPRAADPTASPELLRETAGVMMIVGDSSNPFNPAAEDFRDAAIQLLRRAAAHEHDPLRDQSLYNLASLLGRDAAERAESQELIRQLFYARSHYRRAWYVKRMRGLLHWQSGEDWAAAGDEARARLEFKQAAKWDSRTLWARPKVRLRLVQRPLLRTRQRVLWAPRLPLVKRYRIPPILFGAAAEAHAAAGHRLRGRYYAWRQRRRSSRLMNLGEEGLARQDWAMAYANFDWVAKGKATLPHCMALVGKAVALQQIGRADLASQALAHARGMTPDGAPVAETTLAYFSRYPLPAGLPQ